VAQLFSVILTHLPQMNLVNLSTAVHRLAKLTANDSIAQADLRRHPALEELLRATSLAFSHLDPNEAQPQSLSNVAWSLATLRLANRQLIQVISGLAVAKIAWFKPFELSTMLWAFAKLGTIEPATWCAKPVFQAAAAHIMKQVQHFGFRCLATTAWAFATARQRHARLFRSIATQMLSMVHAANCQEMANTAWAFGTADFHDNQLFTELAEKALMRLDSFKPQELSNMLWGFATNGFFHEGFFTSSSLVAQRMDLQAQHLANILWAFARVRPRHPVTQAATLALLPLCVRQLETFKPQEVSSTALAVAKAFGAGDDLERGAAPLLQRAALPALPPQVQEFFGSVTPWVLIRLHEFSAQSLANTVSAYAIVHVAGSEAVFASVAQEVSARYDSLEPTAMIHLLKAFAAAKPGPSVVAARALAGALSRRIQELRPQEVQTLSRICSAALGMRQSRDLGCEELRNCCFALAAGEGIIGVSLPPPALDMERALAPPLHPPPRETAPWQEPLRAPVEDLLVNTAPVHECRPPAPCSPVLNHMSAASSEDHRSLVGHFRMHPDGPVAMCDVVAQVRGPPLHLHHHHHLECAPPRGRICSPPRPLAPAWSTEDRTALGICAPDIVGHLDAAIPDLAPVLSECLDMAPPLPVYPVPPGPLLVDPTPKVVPVRNPATAAARTMPLSTVEELTAVTDGAYTEAAAFVDAQGNVRRPKYPNQMAYSGSPRARAPMGPQGHPDLRWRCSVKNSFLHVEMGDDSEEEGDDGKDDGSSQRSSSVPSRFDHEEYWEERARRQDFTQQDAGLCEGSLARAPRPSRRPEDFDWGRPSRRSPVVRAADLAVPRRMLPPPLLAAHHFDGCILPPPEAVLHTPLVPLVPPELGACLADPALASVALRGALRSTPHPNPPPFGLMAPV